MFSESITFAGLNLSSGGKPVTFAVLDVNLKIVSLERWDTSEALMCLKEFGNIWLGINVPARAKETYTDLKRKITQVGFKPYSKQMGTKQWLDTNTQDCFRAWTGKNPLPRRTLEGRLQRALILYEQGLQIDDPMEIFEEITRYKLMQGVLPLEEVYSSTELDALMAAYLAWMTVNRPLRIIRKADFVLPAPE